MCVSKLPQLKSEIPSANLKRIRIYVDGKLIFNGDLPPKLKVLDFVELKFNEYRLFSHLNMSLKKFNEYSMTTYTTEKGNIVVCLTAPDTLPPLKIKSEPQQLESQLQTKKYSIQDDSYKTQKQTLGNRQSRLPKLDPPSQPVQRKILISVNPIVYSDENPVQEIPKMSFSMTGHCNYKNLVENINKNLTFYPQLKVGNHFNWELYNNVNSKIVNQENGNTTYNIIKPTVFITANATFKLKILKPSVYFYPNVARCQNKPWLSLDKKVLYFDKFDLNAFNSMFRKVGDFYTQPKGSSWCAFTTFFNIYYQQVGPKDRPDIAFKNMLSGTELKYSVPLELTFDKFRANILYKLGFTKEFIFTSTIYGGAKKLDYIKQTLKDQLAIIDFRGYPQGHSCILKLEGNNIIIHDPIYSEAGKRHALTEKILDNKRSYLKKFNYSDNSIYTLKFQKGRNK